MGLEDQTDGGERQGSRSERDFVVIGIAIAAVLLFVATGGLVVPQVISSLFDSGPAPDGALVSAMLLNIALILFGWRRHRELVREVNDRRKAEETARQLAVTDPLTGLFNRRSIPLEMAPLIAQCEERGDIVAALMLDLDNFKAVNDLNGHKIGDQVLIEVSHRMRSVLPPGALLARIGGDEFACALACAPGQREQVRQLADHMIVQVSNTIEAQGLTVDITVSIGIVASDDAGGRPSDEDVETFAGTLLNRADIAMYQSKRDGRNRYAWFDARMESDLRLRNELESGIRRGIGRGEFVPYYQQQMDLKTGELVGFEMLARWNSPKLGMVSPEVFIPIAEEIGVIAELSESLIAQALKDAMEWDPHLTLSVNISPLQLRDPWFAQKLLKMLVDTGFPPNRLDVEITESCLHENLGAVRTVISSLKNQGIRISLDDFGTGYSSLHQLRSLPFDQIKIDRSFVSELMQENANPKLVEAIVSLGRGLEMPVTAEGIETEEVGALLKGMGEMKGQGFLYGRPKDAADTLEFLRQGKDPAAELPEDGFEEPEPKRKRGGSTK